jgi:hypothetical protein
MEILKQHIKCPTCQGPLKTKVIACEQCNLKIEGDFVENEFARLNDDELHFLRIFINCEGRIQDMEKALGVSYPTVKAKMGELKRRLMLDFKENEKQESRVMDSRQHEKPEQILDELDNGTISYEEAITRIKEYKEKK